MQKGLKASAQSGFSSCDQNGQLCRRTSQKLRKFQGASLLKPKPILRIGVSEHAISLLEPVWIENAVTTIL
jgi:hypothetical protein